MSFKKCLIFSKRYCLTCSENTAETGLWSLMVKPMWLRYTCCVTLVDPPNHEVRPLCSAALWVGTGEPVRRGRQRMRSVQAGFLFFALAEEKQIVTECHRGQQQSNRKNEKYDGRSLWWGRLDQPSVVSMSAHIKLIGGWEFQWSLNEALKNGLCVFCHVELWSRQMIGKERQVTHLDDSFKQTQADVCLLCATASSAKGRTGDVKPARESWGRTI